MQIDESTRQQEQRLSMEATSPVTQRITWGIFAESSAYQPETGIAGDRPSLATGNETARTAAILI